MVLGHKLCCMQVDSVILSIVFDAPLRSIRGGTTW